MSVDDADFICQLRNDVERTAYLHRISADTEAQRAWLEDYYQRTGDYYFVVERDATGDAEGLIGLYDHCENAAEWGRWILRKGSLAALESAILIYQFGFDVLACERIYCNTVLQNRRVVSFHDSFGAVRTGVLAQHFTLNRNRYDAVQHEIRVSSWPQIRANNLPLARRLAAHFGGTHRT